MAPAAIISSHDAENGPGLKVQEWVSYMIRQPGSRTLNPCIFAAALIFLSLISGTHAAATAKSFPLGEDVVIVVAPDATRSVRYAADELAGAVERATGGRPEIMNHPLHLKHRANYAHVFVGESGATKALEQMGLVLDSTVPDQYIIKVEPRRIFLVGNDDTKDPVEPIDHHKTYYYTDFRSGLCRYGQTGSLYAVYEFLRGLGFEWYMPGPLGEVLPPRQSVMPVQSYSLRSAPRTPHREYTGVSLGWDKAWAAWYRRAGFGGLSRIRINHSWPDWYERYRRNHPEYFALIDGKRWDIPEKGRGYASLCLSHPEVFDRTLTEVRQFFDDHPDRPLRAVMPNDSFKRFCECRLCEGKDQPERGYLGFSSNHVWDFVNRIAGEIQKSHPGKMIGCCAYESYTLAPDNIGKLNDNVVVMICQHRHHFWDKQYHKKLRASRQRWAELCGGRIFVWEYYNHLVSAPPGRGWDVAPWVAPHVIARDIRELADLRYLGDRIEGTTNRNDVNHFHRPGVHHLPVFVSARVMWDPQLNVDALLDDYYRRFYGPAAAPMEAFFTRMEAIWMEGRWENPDPGNPTGRVFYTHALKIFTPEVLDELFALLAKAELLATSAKDIYLQRIHLIRDEMTPLLAVAGQVPGSFIERPGMPRVVCMRTESAPTIDGRPDDACWENSSPLPIQTIFAPKPIPPTAAKICWDRQALYVIIEADEPTPENIRALATDGDSEQVYNDDHVELFFDPDGDGQRYSHMAVNTRGVLTGDTKGVEVACKVGAGHWVMELRIPWTTARATVPDDLTRWAGNFNRDRFATRSHDRHELEAAHTLSSWSPAIRPVSPGYHNPAKWGTIRFVE